MYKKVILGLFFIVNFIMWGRENMFQLDDTMSIQKIINSIDSKERTVIYLKNGIYKEKLYINKPNIKLLGESKNGVIIEWDDASDTIKRDGSQETYGTAGSASVTIFPEAVGFQAENITFLNSFDYNRSNFKNKQAVALKNDADMSEFRNCNFLGNQDTLYANTGRQYYFECYIEGHVDFIFGAAQAYFEKCEIFSKDKKDEKVNGYVTAASTKETEELGFIFNACNFVSDAKANTVYLGRPWHPGKRPGHNPSVIIMNSDLGKHVNNEGWTVMSGFLPEDARFYEYSNTGIGAKENIKRRVLSKEEAQKITKEKLFKDWKV